MAYRQIPTSLAREDTLEPAIDMEAFLRDVETRAYRIAVVSVRDRDEALDIVQDAMIRLVRGYARRPAVEWRPLFYRILQNRIRDSQRRRTVRTRVMSFFGALDDGEFDPIGTAPAPRTEDPLERLASSDAMAALEAALRMLPLRQREAFMMRNFEGFDVAQTAVAMGCTEGSVKTHYSRAIHRLRELLSEHAGD
jgi:RNA polymerase sigma-70 factor (ECF subfamily)